MVVQQRVGFSLLSRTSGCHVDLLDPDCLNSGRSGSFATDNADQTRHKSNMFRDINSTKDLDAEGAFRN
ncbi:hypothetical protein GJ496_003965 [Pomphorhynchus laevis]|nr:hypothetical protein GJ496_003713 [Pomphorhynchus laevis]KAI0981774.1 hypothetical protein GJ496_003965 [Pomphorhynchus laevis]